MTESNRLGATGQVHVTLAAELRYAEATGLRPEAARRELTEYLLDAVRVGDPDEYPERWRFRRGSAGVDITARVVREGRLVQVVSINVRDYRGGRKR